MLLTCNLCILSLLLLRGSSKILNVTEGNSSKAAPSPSTEAAASHLKTTRGFLHKAYVENILVIEGQNLDLHCFTAGENSSVLEWKNPLGFVIFFNTWRGLRDQRYQLINSSEGGLSVRLSNVTIHDEGIYTCIQYSKQTRRKQVKVTVLAIPSKPVLEAQRIGGRDEQEKVVLKCSTWGGKPHPKISWLLDNGMELLGDIKHQLREKKYNATSTLTIITFTQETSLTCVIRHKALEGGKLTGTLQLEHIRSSHMFTATEENSNVTVLSAATETAKLHFDGTRGSNNGLNATQVTSSTDALPSGTGAMTPDSNTTIREITTDSTTTDAGSYKKSNTTERKASIQILHPRYDTSTLNPWTKDENKGTNSIFKEIIRRKPNIIFPVLVTILLFLLSVIVLLFLVKLWKAHRQWKKENEVAEQTPESNRSRPNEDNHGHEINKHGAVPWNISKKCIKSCTRISKHSEESQDSSVFEKQLPYIKETDL